MSEQVFELSEDINNLSPIRGLVTSLAMENAIGTDDARFQWDDECATSEGQKGLYNYCEKFRTSYKGPKSRFSSPGWSGRDRENAIMFMDDIEKAFVFGRRDKDFRDCTGVARNIMGGLMFFIITNTERFETSITEQEWEDFLVYKAFAEGSNEKIMLCAPFFFDMLAHWGHCLSKEGEVLANNFGFPCVRYDCPTGNRLYLYSYYLLSGSGSGIVIDPDDIRLHYMNGNSSKSNGLIQMQKSTYPDCDYDFTAEMGLEVRNEQKHALILGVNKGKIEGLN